VGAANVFPHTDLPALLFSASNMLVFLPSYAGKERAVWRFMENQGEKAHICSLDKCSYLHPIIYLIRHLAAIILT
jgi:hypothetical protein